MRISITDDGVDAESSKILTICTSIQASYSSSQSRGKQEILTLQHDYQGAFKADLTVFRLIFSKIVGRRSKNFGINNVGETTNPQCKIVHLIFEVPKGNSRKL